MMADSAAADGKETIGYDEYMDGGIPDTLLEGLGFYKSTGGTEADEGDGEGENTDVEDEDTENDGDEINESPLPSSELEAQSQHLARLRSHRMPKIVLRPPAEPAPALTKQSPAQLVVRPPVPVACQPTPRVPTAHSSPFRSGRGNSKIVVKGNIMYERTETGEVIASVIKNGVPKPNPLGGGGGVSMAVSAAASAAMAIQRGRPPAVEPQRPHVASYVAECTLPPDCPITEDNVESVLDRSIAATQTMRRTLTNLKDDLRRMGGGPTVTPALRPIHMQHRVDVACKLANAFVEYRDLIARISNEKCVAKKVANNENALPVKDGGSTSTSLTTTTASNSSATSSDAFSGGSKQGSMPVPRSTTARRKEHSAAAATVAAAPVSARPVVGERLPSKAEQKSRRKAAAPVSSTHKRKATTEVESIVSDDLWMSCEPCD